MNIYEKLNAARVELQKIKKGGKSNVHEYFELGDFLPTINNLAQELKFTVTMSYAIDLATMTIYDAEKPEDYIVFTTPMSTASLPNCHPVQNLGAVHTYLRRYLYLAAFEIAEKDELDAKLGTPEGMPTYGHKKSGTSKTKKAPPQPAPDEFSLAMSPEQIKSLQTFAIQEYGDERAADAYKWALQSLGIESSALLNKTDYEPVMDALRDYAPLPFGFGDDA